MKSIHKVLKGANRAEELVLIGIFILMIFASFAQVLNRNLFQLPLGWLEELARYCQVYVAFLAMELGLRDGTQISLTVVTDHLPARGKSLMDLLAKLIVVIFTILIFVNAINLVSGLMESGQRSPGLKVPMFIPYFALPLSFGIAAVVQSATFIQLLIGFVKHEPGKEAAQ